MIFLQKLENLNIIHVPDHSFKIKTRLQNFD